MYCGCCVTEEGNGFAWYINGHKEEMIETLKVQGTLKVLKAVDPTQFKKGQKQPLYKIWQAKKLQSVIE